MATTASTFRRPKNKGGTRTSIGVEDGRGNRKYHSMGDTRNEYRKGRSHKGAVEDYRVQTTNFNGRYRRRTADDFLAFCTMVLDYENYDAVKREETRRRNSCSPLGSTGSSNGSWFHTKEDESDGPEKNSSEETDYNGIADGTAADADVEDAGEDDEGWDMVTCFCGKPFAGRPMIECSGCSTWIHIKCARLKRTHIPDVWYCAKCRGDNPSLSSANITKTKKEKSRSSSGLSTGDYTEVSDSTDTAKSYKTEYVDTKKVIGSKRRKLSSSYAKVVHNDKSTKHSTCPSLAQQNDSIDYSSSDSPHKPSTSSTASSSIPTILYSNTSQSDNVEKTWDDSGLESASVSPVSGPVSPATGSRHSEEETDSASSGSEQMISHLRNSKKRLSLSATKATRKRKRSNSSAR